MNKITIYVRILTFNSKLHSDNWWNVSLDVLERKIVTWETHTWVIITGLDVFNIGGIFTLARYPNDIGLKMNKSKQIDFNFNINLYLIGSQTLFFLDVLLQFFRHFVWQSFRIVIYFWYPIVNLKCFVFIFII